MKKLFFLLVTSCALLFTGCITIEENYTFKKNGSGSMQYVMDMSELMSQLGAMMDLSQMEGGANPLGEKASFTKIGEKLKGIKGISGIKVEEDNKKYIYKIGFKFKNLQALNDALNKIIVEDSTGSKPYHTFFTQDGNTITRQHFAAGGNMDMASLLGEEGESEYAQTMLEGMKYKINFTMPKEIAAIYTGNQNDEEVLMNGKTAKLSANFKNIAENGSNVLTSKIVMK